jgi:hypothetical protein
MTPERIADIRQYILDLERELDDYIKSQPDEHD